MNVTGANEIQLLVERFREELKSPDIKKNVKNDITTLLTVLQCPVFASILSIQVSISCLMDTLYCEERSTTPLSSLMEIHFYVLPFHSSFDPPQYIVESTVWWSIPLRTDFVFFLGHKWLKSEERLCDAFLEAAQIIVKIIVTNVSSVFRPCCWNLDQKLIPVSLSPKTWKWFI